MSTITPVAASAVDRISVRRQRALEALLAGRSFADAAAEAGVSARTLRRWRQDIRFAGALRAARDEAFAGTITALATLGPRAVVVLAAFLDEDGAEPSHRLRAATVVLDAVGRVSDADIRARLEALEVRLGAPGQ